MAREKGRPAWVMADAEPVARRGSGASGYIGRRVDSRATSSFNRLRPAKGGAQGQPWGFKMVAWSRYGRTPFLCIDTVSENLTDRLVFSLWQVAPWMIRTSDT